jgi:hypothetical protein
MRQPLGVRSQEKCNHETPKEYSIEDQDSGKPPLVDSRQQGNQTGCDSQLNAIDSEASRNASGQEGLGAILPA